MCNATAKSFHLSGIAVASNNVLIYMGRLNINAPDSRDQLNEMHMAAQKESRAVQVGSSLDLLSSSPKQ